MTSPSMKASYTPSTYGKRNLQENNVNSMLLWVLTQNPSRRFYESQSGTMLGKRAIEIGGAKLEEVAYGWPDTREQPHKS
ncbi:hypothetical protein BH24ACT22_BH24ACT22_11430 [soil metagenome]